MESPIIQIKNVNFWYDKDKPSANHALKSINMDIKEGEYVAFFGPSGCGKTTLLYIISGIDLPSDGQVIVNGRDIAKFSKREMAIYRQIGVGIIFQQFNLIPSITVLNNITLPMAFLGISINKRDEEGLKLLDRFGIKNLANRYPHELSGGQQQRVGIARALANNPPIIIADEPLGNLDSDNAQRVLAFLKELNQKDGRTIIMVTHEPWSLQDAQKIFYMKDGAVVKEAGPQRAEDVLHKSLSVYSHGVLDPELSEKEAIAKSLAHLLLRGYSFDEIKRFEFFTNQRFKNNIDKTVFRNVLDRPYKDGGLGLWKPKADKVAGYIEEIIEKKREVEEIYLELEKNPEAPLRNEVEKIREWLLEEYGGQISDFQKFRMDEIIQERLRNIINETHFKRIVNLSKNKFGVGLSFRAAQQISDKMESILQGKLETDY